MNLFSSLASPSEVAVLVSSVSSIPVSFCSDSRQAEAAGHQKDLEVFVLLRVAFLLIQFNTRCTPAAFSAVFFFPAFLLGYFFFLYSPILDNILTFLYP